MILPGVLDCVPAVAGMITAAMDRWTPLRKRVEIRIERSEYAHLIEIRLTGTVCAYDAQRWDGMLLVHLSEPLAYAYRSEMFTPDIVTLEPALRWHGPNRLLLTWTAVNLIDAPSFADRHNARTIATGRLFLKKA